MKWFKLIVLLGTTFPSLGQTITYFEVYNGWGSRYSSQSEGITYSDSSVSQHWIGNTTLEINQHKNKCTIFGYPAPPKYFPVDANLLDAIYFYDSLTSAVEFEIKVTPEIIESLNESHNRKYDCNVDFNQYPFVITSDTVALLRTSVIPDYSEISFICDGIGATFSCIIVYDYTDTVQHGISGNYDLSNSMYLDTTLPIYCLFQEFPGLFVEENYFAPVKESEMGDIICRFIDWRNEEKKMKTGTIRKNIQIGSEVEIVEKHNQRSGELTDGFVERILTKSPNHPHGIKVRLETGEVGRVKNIIEDPLEDI
jgi:uncharacterized repeat protein (TIGR03833 family)